MSTLSSLINWGSSFVVNDLLPSARGTRDDREPNTADSPSPGEEADRAPGNDGTARNQIWVSRITTLLLFGAAAGVAILFVEGMVSWFVFINSAMVMFLLPLSWLRFFWWRFNVWGELAAIVLGLPLSIVVWFVLDFQDEPMWQGLGILFVLSFIVLLVVTAATPPESPETLRRFYRRCRPPGLWGPIREEMPEVGANDPSFGRLMLDSLLGSVVCLGLVLGTNAVFVGDWARVGICAAMAVGLGAWLLARVLEPAASPSAGSGRPDTHRKSDQ